MNSIRQKFYMHIANNGLKENDEWTIELQDKFYSCLNGYERNEYNYLIKELIDNNLIIKNDNKLIITKHGIEVIKENGD